MLSLLDLTTKSFSCPVLRKLWKAAHQIAENLLGGLRTRLSPARRVTSSAELERSLFLGPCSRASWQRRYLRVRPIRRSERELYYFRDQQGLEVDFLVPQSNSNLWLVEATASKTVRPSMAASATFDASRLGTTVRAVDRSPPQVPFAIADCGDRSRGGSSGCGTIRPGARSLNLRGPVCPRRVREHTSIRKLDRSLGQAQW